MAEYSVVGEVLLTTHAQFCTSLVLVCLCMLDGCCWLMMLQAISDPYCQTLCLWLSVCLSTARLVPVDNVRATLQTLQRCEPCRPLACLSVCLFISVSLCIFVRLFLCLPFSLSLYFCYAVCQTAHVCSIRVCMSVCVPIYVFRLLWYLSTMSRYHPFMC